MDLGDPGCCGEESLAQPFFYLPSRPARLELHLKYKSAFGLL